MNLIDFFFPPKCVSCDEMLESAQKRIRLKGGDSLCPKCRAEWEGMKLEPCPRCALPMTDCRCSAPFLLKNGCKTLLKLCAYKVDADCAVKKLVFCLKRKANRKCERFLANQLAFPISRYIMEHEDRRFCITNVPRREKGMVRYGYDHAEILAQNVAKLCSIPYLPMIDRIRDGSEQKNLTGEERISNVKGAFALSIEEAEKARGMAVILIDDVVTTGSSLAECISLLNDSGFTDVTPACVAATMRMSKLNKKQPFANGDNFR